MAKHGIAFWDDSTPRRYNRLMGRPRSFDTTTALRAIEDQFRMTGYAGTSLDDVAAATGLGRGSIYAAFGDKHELFMRSLEEFCQRTEAHVAAVLDGPDETAVSRLHEFLLASAQMGDGGTAAKCMATKFAVELDEQDPEALERVAQSFSVLRRRLRDCVLAAQRHGDVDPSADADVVAGLLYTVTRGLQVMASAGQTAEELEPVAEAAFRSLPFTRTLADSHR
jgi:TetR/AcrR family transcriptional regulator, transcriptional repressor for nem operon